MRKLIGFGVISLIIASYLTYADVRDRRKLIQWATDIYERHFETFDPSLDCFEFSNGHILGIPAEYYAAKGRQKKMHKGGGFSFLAHYQTLEPRLQGAQIIKGVHMSVSIRQTLPGFNEGMFGPEAYNHFSGFDIADGSVYGLARYKLPASNDFRNEEFYKYIADSGYVDSVFIECTRKRVVSNNHAFCKMYSEVAGGIRIESGFDKALLPEWRKIDERLKSFLHEKLLIEWGDKCR
ncbi:hypothetical protein [Paremcibacter congregatus]|uniref:Uncharacterized protein n=1 Tax=Paremcibacter congregatus TaxID=2043170 RepID=A0A2G4YWF0_9PROT|nr:hypothetical protein [Paremcibacter congregatus]PHZ86672.1 hypothetical protein CRD36_02000 [Paremcibacter congregatus]QDE26472.1 hypothetical protein FIV45_03875 [Paremcibacter congregatus]